MYNRAYTPDKITQLNANEIFVFGSNLSGSHGGGAARLAHERFGAEWGKGVGLQGRSYAIPTMQGGVETIRPYVDEFIRFAREHAQLTFLVTRVGCGIAGFRDEEIAPLFQQAVDVPNIILPEQFVACFAAQQEGMLAVGTRLANGRYVIERYLSSGGFGNTYVATDTTFDEEVAIKELYIKGICGRYAGTTGITVSLTENRQVFSAQQEKFRKEARRLRKLPNPHIVGVHDLFDENGTSYYVMDFVRGESLSALTKRKGKPMTESELMFVLPQVLDALEYVHANGIWHLDLKPANIMAEAAGNVLLIDFGASKQLRNANGESLSTSTSMCYTPGYAPSEQIEQSLEKFGPWTDLYALGATMYNLLTRQQPPSPSDISEDPEEAFQSLNGISERTRRLILWLMTPNRKLRPQSVAEVKQFLAEENAPEQEPEPNPAPKPAPVPDTKADAEVKSDDTITFNDIVSGSNEKNKTNTGSTDNTLKFLSTLGVIVAISIVVFLSVPRGQMIDSDTYVDSDSDSVAAAYYYENSIYEDSIDVAPVEEEYVAPVEEENDWGPK